MVTLTVTKNYYVVLFVSLFGDDGDGCARALLALSTGIFSYSNLEEVVEFVTVAEPILTTKNKFTQGDVVG